MGKQHALTYSKSSGDMYPPCISPGVASEGGDLQTKNNVQKLIQLVLNNMLNGLFCLNVECKRNKQTNKQTSQTKK